MLSEITLEQYYFTAFFASSELFSCLSRSVAEVKISQGRSLIVKVLKTRDPLLLRAKEDGPEQSKAGTRSRPGVGGAAGKPRQLVPAPEGSQVCRRNGRSVKQLPAERSVP